MFKLTKNGATIDLLHQLDHAEAKMRAIRQNAEDHGFNAFYMPNNVHTLYVKNTYNKKIDKYKISIA